MKFKMNVLDIKTFFATVNTCGDSVRLLLDKEHSLDLKKNYAMQMRMAKEYHQKGYLPIALEVKEPKDYFRLVYAVIA